MNIKKIRKDFPVLQNNPDLIYLDNAATSLTPKQVIEKINLYYNEFSCNVHRGSHRLSQEATQMYESSREEVASFINSKSEEMVFTHNATESINLVAVCLERDKYFKKGDEIIVSALEHHANLVPWQELCKRTGAKLKIAKLNLDFTLDMSDFESILSNKTKFVSMAHISNTVASILPIKKITKLTHEKNALVLIDAAQSVPHMPVNVKQIGADFVAFSSHKMLGPTGVGCLFGKKDLLEELPPYNFGGSMISKVTYTKSSWASSPEKFEAGTMPIGEVIGLGEAVRYLKKVGIEEIHSHEKKLTKFALERLSEMDGVNVFCPNNSQKQGGIILFDCKGIDPLDLGVGLDESKNIAVRSGMHCAEPIVSSINKQGLARASFYLYNALDEIEAFAQQVMAMSKVVQKKH